jgi:hypothetical protein
MPDKGIYQAYNPENVLTAPFGGGCLDRGKPAESLKNCAAGAALWRVL